MKPTQVKPPISPDLLNQIDVRVGTILSGTDIPTSGVGLLIFLHLAIFRKPF